MEAAEAPGSHPAGCDCAIPDVESHPGEDISSSPPRHRAAQATALSEYPHGKLAPMGVKGPGQFPFRVRQIARIAQPVPIVFAAVRFRPHRFHALIESTAGNHKRFISFNFLADRYLVLGSAKRMAGLRTASEMPSACAASFDTGPAGRTRRILWPQLHDPDRATCPRPVIIRRWKRRLSPDASRN